ncbi:MAG TPA: hypothetical protein PLN13_03380 [Bacteroidia bacterium]|nr:hypothetical protein [Bacteroidia bacterium]HRH07596.1 hypothetical protein [Bacteroidia bacterium]
MFEKIAPYLKDPLVLIGFFLFISFLFLRALVVRGIIPTLQQNQGYNILKQILLYGFIIGLFLIGLGFALKYREISEQEQKNLVSLLASELDNNIHVIAELKLNTESFIKEQTEVSRNLRTNGIRILPIMFPIANLNLDSNLNTNTLAQDAFRKLIDAKLPTNKLEMQKLNAFARAITRTLLTIKQTNENLMDKGRTRYKIENQIWQSNLEVYKKINIINISLFQKAYNQENNIRNDYEIIANATVDYLNHVISYFDDNNNMSWEQLATLLSIERQSYSLMIEYSNNLVNTLKDLSEIKSQLLIDNKVAS